MDLEAGARDAIPTCICIVFPFRHCSLGWAVPVYYFVLSYRAMAPRMPSSLLSHSSEWM